MRIVVDTNVVRSGIFSPTGASREILLLVDEGVLTPVVSVPLLLEYESVLKRAEFLQDVGLSSRDIDDILDRLLSRSSFQIIHFLWRPFLPDARDDCVLECAVNGRADVLLTFNKRDFPNVEKHFGVRICTPGEFLHTAGG
jgi:putative PIN family toxin of toxin-antitoxin system